jgi:hypothetical protein
VVEGVREREREEKEREIDRGDDALAFTAVPLTWESLTLRPMFRRCCHC